MQSDGNDMLSRGNSQDKNNFMIEPYLPKL
jgi:hypothetical protein